MKVILTEDVYKHGVAGEVVDVAPGFARNYLLPQGMAVKATAGALKQWEKLLEQAQRRRELRDQELSELAEQVKALTIAFPVKAGETGKLYGSVTTAHIADAIAEAVNYEIDNRRVGDNPLRELGEHKVRVRLSSDLQPEVTVLVHREEEPPESVLGMTPVEDEEVVEDEPSIFEDVMAEGVGPDDELEGEDAVGEVEIFEEGDLQAQDAVPVEDEEPESE